MIYTDEGHGGRHRGSFYSRGTKKVYMRALGCGDRTVLPTDLCGFSQ